MTYVTEEGESISADSPEEILQALKVSGRFTADQTDEQYMAGFAERYREWANKAVRSDRVENFVNDLVVHGYLKAQP